MSPFATRTFFLSLLILVILAASPAGAQQRLVSESEGSRLEFIARYEDEELPGRFRRFTVEVERDSETGHPKMLIVDVDTASADMNDRDINDELQQAAWFDTSSFPSARFGSSRIRQLDGRRFIAEGHLVLKGHRQSVEVPFAWLEKPEGFSISGELVLSRLAWGIGSGEWAEANTIADEVRLSFEVSLAADP